MTICLLLFNVQPPNCAGGKRIKRDSSSFDEGHPATIEVYSGLYVNENAEIVEGNDDSVLAEKVSRLQLSQNPMP